VDVAADWHELMTVRILYGHPLTALYNVGVVYNSNYFTARVTITVTAFSFQLQCKISALQNPAVKRKIQTYLVSK